MPEPAASENPSPEPVIAGRGDGQLRIDDVSILQLMTLEPHGPDTYVGIAPRYNWGRLFGGQVVAQALRAAQLTVPPDHEVHSLHSYFIRGGTHQEPVRFEVDRIRNGRSFITRRVVARQSNGAILNLEASFQLAEEAPDVQPLTMPDVAGPDGLEDVGWGGMLGRRIVDQSFGHATMWIRLEQEVPTDPALRNAIFAFISDSVPTTAVRATHPVQLESRNQIHSHFMGASLDHNVYFHRPVHPGEWLLADVVCHGLVGARGLSVGNVFDRLGTHVATVVQEVLLRERRKPGRGSEGLGGKEG